MYTAQSLVMITANSEDIKNLARKFLSESLSDQIAELIVKSSSKLIEPFTEGNESLSIRYTQPDNNMIDNRQMSSSIELTPHNDTSDVNVKEIESRAVQELKNPIRTTKHSFQIQDTLHKERILGATHIKQKQRQVHIIPFQDIKKYQNNNDKLKYRSGEIEDLQRDLMKTDNQFHDQKDIKLTNERQSTSKYDSDSEEKEILKNQYSDRTIKQIYQPQDEKSSRYHDFIQKTTKEYKKNIGNKMSKHYQQNQMIQQQKDLLRFVNRFPEYKKFYLANVKKHKQIKPYSTTNLNKKYVNNQETPKNKTKHQTHGAKDYIKGKELYLQEYSNTRETQQTEHKHGEPESDKDQYGFNKKNRHKKYYKQEPQDIEPQQSKDSDKIHTYLKDQLKLHQYPDHNVYYPEKPRIEPGLDPNDKEVQKYNHLDRKEFIEQHHFGNTEHKILDKAESIIEPTYQKKNVTETKYGSSNKESIKTDKIEYIKSSNFVASFQITKEPMISDENESFLNQAKTNVDKHSSEESEAAGKQENFLVKKSTVYHGSKSNKEENKGKHDLISNIAKPIEETRGKVQLLPPEQS